MEIKEKFTSTITQSKMPLTHISKLSGIKYRTIQSWIYTDSVPSIENANTVLKAIGYELVIKELKK